MAKLFIEDTTLTSIGDAIRGKAGTTEKIAPLDMATAITNLPSGNNEQIMKFAWDGSLEIKTSTPYTRSQDYEIDTTNFTNLDLEIYFSHPTSIGSDDGFERQTVKLLLGAYLELVEADHRTYERGSYQVKEFNHDYDFSTKDWGPIPSHSTQHIDVSNYNSLILELYCSRAVRSSSKPKGCIYVIAKLS